MTLAGLKKMEPLFGSWYLDDNAPLGKGSFGSVYKLRKEDEDGNVSYAAMKVVSIPSSGEDLEGLGSRRAQIDYINSVVDGLKQEIRLMDELKDCKNVVAYEEYKHIVASDKMHHDILIRMELLSDLDNYFKAKRATALDVLKMWRDITAALMVCEKRMIVHRDIKPSNIMVSVNKKGNATYKLVDFGIARRLSDQGVASTRAGSVGYMAPEVYSGKGSYNGIAVDIYSLGIVIYRELNCMRYPFLPAYPEQYNRDVLDAALTERFSGTKVPPINGMPDKLNRVLLKCLEYDPKRRYATASDLMRDLDKLSEYEDMLEGVRLYDEQGTILPNDAPAPKPKKHAGLIVAVIAMTAVLAVTGFVIVRGMLQKPDQTKSGEGTITATSETALPGSVNANTPTTQTASADMTLPTEFATPEPTAIPTSTNTPLATSSVTKQPTPTNTPLATSNVKLPTDVPSQDVPTTSSRAHEYVKWASSGSGSVGKNGANLVDAEGKVIGRIEGNEEITIWSVEGERAVAEDKNGTLGYINLADLADLGVITFKDELLMRVKNDRMKIKNQAGTATLSEKEKGQFITVYGLFGKYATVKINENETGLAALDDLEYVGLAPKLIYNPSEKTLTVDLYVYSEVNPAGYELHVTGNGAGAKDNTLYGKQPFYPIRDDENDGGRKTFYTWDKFDVSDLAAGTYTVRVFIDGIDCSESKEIVIS